MQYFFFSLMIQDFKPGNNSVDVLICLRASRVGGWAKTMSARVERQRCHRSSYFTVPISNSWKSNKAHIIFQMHARKTPRIHRKKPTTPYIHRLFQLIFQKICGSMSIPCKRCKKITFLHFPRCQSLKKKKIRVVTRVSSILVSHRWVWRHKKKEKKMYNDDCKYTGCKFYSRVCKIDSNSDKRKCWYVKSINCWDFLTIFLFVFIF